MNERLSPKRWLVLSGIILASSASQSCSDPIVPYRADPLVYVVLNQRALPAGAPGMEQRAFLMTVGSPIGSDYLVAQGFEMRRAADGALFTLVDMGQRGAIAVSASEAQLHNANYALPDTAIGPSLGALDIQPNDVFSLEIVINNDTIRGQARVPASFVIAVQQVGADRVAVWPRVPGAESYSVELSGLTAPSIQRDTFFVLPSLPPSGAQLRVNAIDANLSRFLADARLTRAGLDAGSGVFGAITKAAILVTP